MPEESWYSFDLRPAILELWLVWSEKPVEELEAIRRWANERDRGSIQDASERERIRRLFTEAAAKVPERSDNGVEETVRLAAARVAWKIRLATR